MSDEIKWGPTGELVYDRTYARTKPDGSRESWPETVTRVVDGNLALVDARYRQEGERESLIDLMESFKILPGGRHLWASGVKNAQHLFNPVVGSSEVTTRDGVRKISELVGETIDVLSMSDDCDMATRKWHSVGSWRPAKFIYSGEQDTYRVTFESGREVVSTAEHNWFSVRSRKKLTTLDLVGESIPVMATPRPVENLEYMQGLLRGIIFGDGTVDTTGSKIQIYADESEEVIDLFRRAGHKHSYSESRGFWYVGRLPMEWKLELPSLAESPSFWRGFFSGWLAADGHVNKKGSVMLFNRDKWVFDHCRPGLEKAGIHMINDPVLCRTVNPFNGTASTLYRQSFKRYSLSEGDFIQKRKRDRFLGTPISLRTTTDKVVAVERTGLTEPVYCCLEQATHSWTVNGVLTGNCWVAGWDDKPSSHFEFLFMRLMEGGGVGASYSNSHLAKYPPVQQELYVHIVCDEEHPDYEAMKDAGILSTEYDSEWSGAFVVEDSREGWASALVDLIDTHYRDEVTHFQRVYDVSRVRPAGAKLKTFGGRASGPQPFSKMLIDVCEILSHTQQGYTYAGYGFGCMTGIDAMEIDHAIAQCVVAGGVRRAARMAMMHWNDPQIAEFLDAKRNSGSHWTTNISVEVDRDFWDHIKNDDSHRAAAVLMKIAIGMVNNGEPGFWDSSLSNVGEPNPVICTNPCGEITLEAWEPCNLGHINLAGFVTANNKVDVFALIKAHVLMTRFLIRATFSEVGDPKSAEVLARNRRIGVGHFGVASFLALTGKRYSEAPLDREFKDQLRALAGVVDDAAAEFCHELRIPVPVKKRTVAPTGTIAKMPGVSEGIHPIFSKYFKRRVRFSMGDPDQMQQVDDLEALGYHVEEDLFAANTLVVTMPTKDTLVQAVVDRYGNEDIVEAADDLTLNQMLAFQAMYQMCWADNAVSFTANVDPDEYTAADVAEQITKFGGLLKGATIFPEQSFQQAPYERITKEEYEAAKAKTVEDGVDIECSSGICPVR